MTAPSQSPASTHAAKPHHEPEENEARMKALLAAMVDEIEAAVQRALDHGLEAEVRALFVRLTPPPAAAPDVSRLLELSNLAQFLDDHAKRAARGSANAKRALHFRDFLRGEVARTLGRAKA